MCSPPVELLPSNILKEICSLSNTTQLHRARRKFLFGSPVHMVRETDIETRPAPFIGSLGVSAVGRNDYK